MLRDAINETSAFVCEKMDSLFESNNAVDKDIHDRILGMIARFGLEIADGTNRVVADRENQNGAGHSVISMFPFSSRDFGWYMLGLTLLVWRKLMNYSGGLPYTRTARKSLRSILVNLVKT